MTSEEAYQLARVIVRAGYQGEPMPATPQCVSEQAVKDAYALGVVRRKREERREAAQR